MGHIHTEHGEHDLTASAFIVRTDFDDPKILLHMHKKLHSLLPPGGHVELNENPWDAVQHEITEETGYATSQLKILQPKERFKSATDVTLHPYPLLLNTHNFTPDGSHKHIDISFAFATSESPAGMPDSGESSDIRWLSAAEVADPAQPILENVREITQYILSTVITNWEEVALPS